MAGGGHIYIETHEFSFGGLRLKSWDAVVAFSLRLGLIVSIADSS